MRVHISNQNLSVLLLIIASVGISFGGLIMRNIDYADAWQISFFRSLGFISSVTIVLLEKYKFKLFINIKKIGRMGILGSLFLMSAHLLFILSFSKTTIANTLFTLSFIPFLTAILGLIFLNEKISFRTFIIMTFALIGILIMIKDSLNNNDYYGNVLALFCAVCFSCFIIIIRKYNYIDMLPCALISGIFLVTLTLVVNLGNIIIPMKDILLCFFWGALLHCFMNIVFIFSSRFLYASEITLFMLVEFSLGPFWVWVFLDETFSENTLYGGIIVLLSVATYSFLEMYSQKKLKNVPKIKKTY